MKNIRRPLIFLLSTLFLLFLPACGKKREIHKKQIILISIDTLRGDHLSSYGYRRDTSPNISQLVKESVYYNNAYPNGCWTMPSHMSLFTGTLPSRHGINVDWQSITDGKYPQLNSSLKNIAEILKSNRIKTIKYAMLPANLGFSVGFDEFLDRDPFANETNFNRLLEILDKNKQGDFFLFLHTWMVHAPYTNSHFLEKGKLSKEKCMIIDDFRNDPNNASESNKNFLKFSIENNLFNTGDIVSLYDGGIWYVDRYIGKLIEKLRRLGIYDDTLFIVVSDHGEHFGEHFPNLFWDFHGQHFYEEFVKIPIIFKYPKDSVEPGVNSGAVSLIDLLPTILDFYNFKIPSYIQGNSLLVDSSKKSKRYIFSEALSIPEIEKKMILMENFKYIVTMDNPSNTGRVSWGAIKERELYDLKKDPLEKNNLYSDLKYRNLCLNLEKNLQEALNNSVKNTFKTNKAVVDPETLKQLKTLGYLE